MSSALRGTSPEDYDLFLARKNKGLGRSGLDLDIESLSVSGTPINSIPSVVASLDFPNTAAQQGSDLTVSVPGARSGCPVFIGAPNGSVNPHSSYFAWVSADDVVTLRFCNFSAAPIDPAPGDFRVVVFVY